MDFKTCQRLYPTPRIGKYSKACGNDKQKTMQLYRDNLRLCQRFFGVLNLFEVMLRNAINEHYAAHFADADNVLNWSERPDKIIKKIDSYILIDFR